MKSIAFGQYYPAESPLHRLDPRVKIILTILYIVCSFMCKNVLSYALLLISAIALVMLGRIPLRIVLKGLKAAHNKENDVKQKANGNDDKQKPDQNTDSRNGQRCARKATAYVF